jgi:hypothetical protein
VIKGADIAFCQSESAYSDKGRWAHQARGEPPP